MQQRRHDPGAAGAERMAQCDRTAVDVQAVERHVEFTRPHQRHRREGLVDLEQVDVAGRQPGHVQHLARRRHRPGQHQGRVGADRGERADAGARLEAQAVHRVTRHQEQHRGAVRNLGGITGTELAVGTEARLQRGQLVGIGAGTDGLVRIEAVRRGLGPVALLQRRHRHSGDLAFEIPGLRGGGGAPVAFDGVGVQLGAAQVPLVGDAFRGLALAGQLVAVGRHPAEGLAVDLAVAAHAHAAHVLRAARHDHPGGTGGDQAGREVHGDLAGAALAVDREAGNGVRPAGAEQRRARDVGRLFTDLGHAAEDDVVDGTGVDPGAVHEDVQQVRRKMVGAHAGQAALVLADRRAHRLDDVDVLHSALAFRPEPGTRCPASS